MHFLFTENTDRKHFQASFEINSIVSFSSLQLRKYNLKRYISLRPVTFYSAATLTNGKSSRLIKLGENEYVHIGNIHKK